MKGHYTTVFSNQQGVAARACARGVVSLSVGHTCLTLRKEEFLRLAQVIRAMEGQLSGRQDVCPGERRH